MQPEYIVEFEYVTGGNQSAVADFGECVAVLENTGDEFINAQNINTHVNTLNQIYNKLVQEVSNYQFENIEQDSHPNLEIQAGDLDKVDIGSIKIMLVNYFKSCLSRSEAYYELNPNAMLQPPEDFDFKKLSLPETLKYCNLSNMKIKSLSFLKHLPNL